MSMLPVGIGGRRRLGYEIEKSLRFRASASANLSRTFTGSGYQTATLSMWVKRGQLGTAKPLAQSYSGASSLSMIQFNTTSDQMFVYFIISGVDYGHLYTPVYRDPSAHYHVQVVLDSTNATASDRIRTYINGVRITAITTSYGDPPLNYVFPIFRSSWNNYIGRNQDSASFFDGQMSEIHFVDGQALTPNDFGKTDPATGQWGPKAYTGSYGTNGFYLPFTDGTSLTTLGYDESGNNNDWTLNNFSLTAGVTYDWMDDTPTNNFCVLNPIQGAQGTISNANLALTSTTANWQSRAGTIAVDSGKWYWEVTITSGGNYISLGIDAPVRLYTVGQYCGDSATGYGYREDAQKVTSGFPSAYGASYTTNDIIGVALDLDSGELTFYKNGVSQGVAFTGLTGEFVPAFSVYTNTRAVTVNFGQRPFAYTPPTGFLALSTANLPVPAVRNGSEYFDVVLDSGANIKTASEARFANFFEWIKDRANVNNHQLIDSVRGSTAVLQSNTTAAETTYSAPSGNSIGWVWRLAAGFLDVVTYTGNGSNRTIAHNLGVAPAMVVVKARTTAGGDQGWPVYHKANTAAPGTDYLLLNTTAATADLDTVWNDTAPTSSVFSVGTNALVNTLNDTYVAYLFAEAEGFSKFGSYVGNGSADGPFVWCGFKPRFVMIKCTSAVSDWYMFDAERDTDNVVDTELNANLTAAETPETTLDFLSNGFKLRLSALPNTAQTFVFAAFADVPFKHATAR